jgi:hypothetical protein
MFSNSDLDANSSRPEGVPSRGWAIAIGACMLPIYLGFSAFGLAGKGTAAACAVATLIIAVRMHMEHARKVWFWVLVVAIASVDVLLIVYVPFPNKNYTFPIVAPFGYLEYVLISACIGIFDKRSTTPDGGQQSNSKS